ncbi:MAG: hypothetical protein ABI353_22985 [Isosphaeraceae bacterium]
MPSEPRAEPPVEQDDRFPSGPWTGFFLEAALPPGRHWMELTLTFREGEVRGDGRDRVGEFLIRGKYQLSDGKCWWSKRYIGRHDVAYDGYNEGKGIWGTWEIPNTLRGGFHIWPLGMSDPTVQRLAEHLDLPPLEVAEPLVPAEAEVAAVPGV